MMKMLRKKRKGGFTLIELIVVIVILGILAAIAIPRLTGFQETARVRAHASNIKVLTSSATIYVAENGNPGTAITGLTSAAPGVLAGYVEVWPTDPWNRTPVQSYSVAIATDGSVTISGVTAP